MSDRPPPAPASEGTGARHADDAAQPALWEGDGGTLREPSRRVLVQLLRGPYLSAARHSNLWSALMADEEQISARLADLFLELVADHESQVAFVRNVQAAEDAPRVMRTATLTFLDTALLLHLRQQLLHDSHGSRTIVGVDEVSDQLQVYRGRDNADPSGFSKRINSSWMKMVKYGLLAPTSTDGRFEVSPVLRLVFGPEEISAVRAEYRRLSAETTEAEVEATEPQDRGSAVALDSEPPTQNDEELA